MSKIKNLLSFYIEHKKYYNIGLIFHFLGGYLLSETLRSMWWLFISLFAFIIWIIIDSIWIEKKAEDIYRRVGIFNDYNEHSKKTISKKRDDSND